MDQMMLKFIENTQKPLLRKAYIAINAHRSAGLNFLMGLGMSREDAEAMVNEWDREARKMASHVPE